MIDQKNLDCYVIVIKDNEVSEKYFSYIKDSWESRGFNLIRFDAVTPETLDDNLRFSDYLNTKKYIKNKILKEFSPTEKAAFNSHLKIWEKCWKSNKKTLVIEHDALLYDWEVFQKVWNIKCDVMLFGLGASCYSITPRVCEKLVLHTQNNQIESGPMSFIADTNSPYHNYRCIRLFEKLGEKNLPVKHIYDESIGTTINHYENLPSEEWIKEYSDRDKKQRDKFWWKIKT